MTKTLSMLVAGVALVFAAGLMAETIVFSDLKLPDVDNADLRGDTIFSVRYSVRVGNQNVTQSKRPWEILRFQFDKKNKDLEAMQWNWNDHLRRYSTDSLPRQALDTIPKMLADTANLDQLGRNAAESAIVWMRAAYVRAMARHSETDEAGIKAFKQAVTDWETAVKAYVENLDRLKEPNTDYAIGGKGHGLSQLKAGRVHASAFKVWSDVGDYYIRGKHYDLAWEHAGQVIEKVGAEVARSAKDEIYLTGIAYPQVESIAHRIADAARQLDGDEATEVWKVAEKAYEAMVRLSAQMQDGKVQEGTSRLALADCQIWTGGQAKARATFKRFIDEHKKIREAGEKKAVKKVFGDNDPKNAALAFNGLGKIAYSQGKYDDALRAFATSTTNFSAYKDARAEAVLYTGLCYAKLAADTNTNKESKKYLLEVANGAMNELSTVLSETPVFNRRSLLAKAIEAAEAVKASD